MPIWVSRLGERGGILRQIIFTPFVCKSELGGILWKARHETSFFQLNPQGDFCEKIQGQVLVCS